MKCKECDRELSDDAIFCSKCGKPVLSSSNKINCEECSYEMDGSLKYCPKCGKYNSSLGDNKNRRDREDDDDDDGGILGGIGDLIGKLFG